MQTNKITDTGETKVAYILEKFNSEMSDGM